MFERLLALVSGAPQASLPPAELPTPEINRGEQLRAELHEVTAQLNSLDQDIRCFFQFHSIGLNRFQQIISCQAGSFEHKRLIEVAWRGFLKERDALMRKFTAILQEGNAYWSHHA